MRDSSDNSWRHLIQSFLEILLRVIPLRGNVRENTNLAKEVDTVFSESDDPSSSQRDLSRLMFVHK